MTRALFVFVDGIGLGAASDSNPFATAPLPGFARLSGGSPWTADASPIRQLDHVFGPIDATLGVEGLPQSGTGQAALLTGLNAAEIHRRHFGPYPPTTVRPHVANSSIFAQLVAQGIPPNQLAFANAYPDRFFRFVEARGRWTTTTLAAHSAGVRLRTADDLRDGLAIPADLTGEGWKRVIDRSFQPFDEPESARRVHQLVASHRLTLVEYYLTDKAGHSQDPERASSILASLDRFFQNLVEGLDLSQTLLVLTSDHGNLEDLSVKTHTRNPVPLVALGAGADRFADASSLLDVTPMLMNALVTG
ncbi:MAG: alkaline phosphatase family protein [Rubricoccaceae bacterium]